MSSRDRMVLIGILVVAVLGAGWMLVVSPERQQATKLSAQLGEAQTQLTSAEGQLANARQAQAQYAAAYASIVSLGKAVPASQEVPSLIYQLSQASNQRNVEFASITTSGSTGSSSASSTSAPAAAAAGFTQMPFTFGFNGSFFALEHLFAQLDNFTKRTAAGDLEVNGRLLTIQSVKLAPLVASGEAAGATPAGLTGTITATAYELPAEGSLTGSPATGTPGAAGTAPASTGAPSSPTAPAVARVTP